MLCLGPLKNKHSYYDTKQRVVEYTYIDCSLNSEKLNSTFCKSRESYWHYLEELYQTDSEFKDVIHQAIERHRNNKRVLLLCDCIYVRCLIRYDGKTLMTKYEGTKDKSKFKCHALYLADFMLQKMKDQVVREYAPFPEEIHNLANNEVFVFDTDTFGSHTSGYSGYAMFGTMDNHFAKQTIIPGTLNMTLQTAKQGQKGLWAVLGQVRGLQEGIAGKSYAIPTMTLIRKKRSRSVWNVQKDLEALWEYAQHRLDLIFLMAPIGIGLAGFSTNEIQIVIDLTIAKKGLPANLKLPQYHKLKQKDGKKDEYYFEK